MKTDKDIDYFADKAKEFTEKAQTAMESISALNEALEELDKEILKQDNSFEAKMKMKIKSMESSVERTDEFWGEEYSVFDYWKESNREVKKKRKGIDIEEITERFCRSEAYITCTSRLTWNPKDVISDWVRWYGRENDLSEEEKKIIISYLYDKYGY